MDNLNQNQLNQQVDSQSDITPTIKFETDNQKKKQGKIFLVIGYIVALMLAFVTGALIVWYLMFDNVT